MRRAVQAEGRTVRDIYMNKSNPELCTADGHSGDMAKVLRMSDQMSIGCRSHSRVNPHAAHRAILSPLMGTDEQDHEGQSAAL